MLHSYVHGGLCVAIQYDTKTLIINPTLDNIQQKQRLLQHPGSYIVDTCSVETVSNNILSEFSLVFIDTSVVVTVAGLSLLYFHGSTSLEKVAGLKGLDLLLVDFSVGMDMACQIAGAVTAKTVVPINLVHGDDPVGFCREVMLHHRGVPKYLKNGQYVVHDVVV